MTVSTALPQPAVVYQRGDVVSLSQAQVEVLQVLLAQAATYSVTINGLVAGLYVSPGGETLSAIAAKLAQALGGQQVLASLEVQVAGAQITLIGPRGVSYALTTTANVSSVISQAAVAGRYSQDFRVMIAEPLWSKQPAPLVVPGQEPIAFQRLTVRGVGTGISIQVRSDEVLTLVTPAANG